MKKANRQRLLLLLPPLLVLAGFVGLWLQAVLEARKWDRQGEEMRQRAMNDPAGFGGPKFTILQALQGGQVEADFSGDARGPLLARLSNLTAQPLGVIFEAGQGFLTRQTDAQLLVMREEMVLLGPQETREVTVAALAGTIFNDSGQHSYLAEKRRDPSLQRLWDALEDEEESPDAEVAQLALLLARENLPLSAVAKFDLLGAERPAIADRAGFFYSPHQLISAVTLLRDAGFETAELAVLVDPQFKMETLLDPQSRPLAQEFFGLNTKTEWGFWHDALLEGQDLLRPRALLGIGRYYPDVALRMLPQWARFENVSFRFRVAALQGLAEIGTPESGALLKKLRWEFRQGHPLETSALEALALHEKYRQTPLVPDHLKFRAETDAPQLAATRPQQVEGVSRDGAPVLTAEPGQEPGAGAVSAATLGESPASSPFAVAGSGPDLAPEGQPDNSVADADAGEGDAPDDDFGGLDLVAMAENLAGQTSPVINALPTADAQEQAVPVAQASTSGNDAPSEVAAVASREAAGPVEEESAAGNAPMLPDATIAEGGDELDFAGMAEALAAGQPVVLSDDSSPEESAPVLDPPQDEAGAEQEPAVEEVPAPEEEVLRVLGMPETPAELSRDGQEPLVLPEFGQLEIALFIRSLTALLVPDYAGAANQSLVPLWFNASLAAPVAPPATAALEAERWERVEG